MGFQYVSTLQFNDLDDLGYPYDFGNVQPPMSQICSRIDAKNGATEVAKRPVLHGPTLGIGEMLGKTTHIRLVSIWIADHVGAITQLLFIF